MEYFDAFYVKSDKFRQFPLLALLHKSASHLKKEPSCSSLIRQRPRVPLCIGHVNLEITSEVPLTISININLRNWNEKAWNPETGKTTIKLAVLKYTSVHHSTFKYFLKTPCKHKRVGAPPVRAGVSQCAFLVRCSNVIITACLHPKVLKGLRGKLSLLPRARLIRLRVQGVRQTLNIYIVYRVSVKL